MFGLLKTLTKEQKGDLQAHLPTLTFAYNATPHSTTGYQPYELMFGRKAPTPCDNWLRLRQYNDNKSISKVVWVSNISQHSFELMLHEPIPYLLTNSLSSIQLTNLN